MPKKFDPVVDIPDLSGKVIVVTGGNAGLGAETIRRLVLKSPKKLFLCARNLSKASALIKEINPHPGVIQAIHLDLDSLESSKAAAKNILAATDRLDIVFLNAGVSGNAPALTKEGYEYQLGVNHMGHAMFTQGLLSLMLTTASEPNSDVRIITTSSEAIKIFAPKAGLVLDECKTNMSSYGGMTRYGQSKLANLLFSNKLAQLYPSIKCIAIHPGMVRTEIFGKADGAGWFTFPWRMMLLLSGLTVQEGAKNQLWAATAKDVQSGKFYFPIGKEDDGGKFGKDQSKMDELWDWTTKELKMHAGKEWPEA